MRCQDSLILHCGSAWNNKSNWLSTENIILTSHVLLFLNIGKFSFCATAITSSRFTVLVSVLGICRFFSRSKTYVSIDIICFSIRPNAPVIKRPSMFQSQLTVWSKLDLGSVTRFLKHKQVWLGELCKVVQVGVGSLLLPTDNPSRNHAPKRTMPCCWICKVQFRADHIVNASLIWIFMS